MSGEIYFPMTLSELEQGEALGCGFNVGEVWDAADFGDAETRNKIEGEWAFTCCVARQGLGKGIIPPEHLFIDTA